MTGISVLCPSRGRPGSLARTLAGLAALAKEPDQLQLLVAADPDDQPTAQAALLPRTQVWVAPERYGYAGLHHYLNKLAGMADGHWLLLWNDDARMLTPGWDDLIAGQPDGVVWMKANHAHHANLFPAWPRSWMTAGPFPTMHVDTWLQYAADQLGCHRRVPVEVLHDRYDQTGNHGDVTYAEGREPLGSEGMQPDFHEVFSAEFHPWLSRLKNTMQED